MRSLVGGAAVPESLIRAFDKHGMWLLQGWGMTETSPLATISYPRAELRDAGDDERYRRAAMAGVPVPLVDLRVRGDDGADAAVGRQRRWARSRCAGRSSPAATTRCRRRRRSSPPTAGCAPATSAAIDALGFVRITDRTKDLIKSGGEWISSVDLENALMAHPAIAEAAVIAIPDEKWSERPLACVVLKAGQHGDAGGSSASTC